MSIKCPICHLFFEEDDLSVGEIVYCSECEKDFEVIKIKPVRLIPLNSLYTEGSEIIEEDYFG